MKNYLCVLILGMLVLPVFSQDTGDDFAELRQNAEKGDADAQYLLAQVYRFGFLFHNENGTRVLLSAPGGPDLDETARWFRAAAKQGNASAQVDLGFMYDRGQGVSQDYAEAARWYREAAEQGDAQGQNYLGVLYYNGWGVPQDYTEAIRWFRAAAEQGLSVAFQLGTLYYRGEVVEQDYAEAIRWFRSSAENGHMGAQYWLGTMYEQGQEVSSNYVQAHMWFSLAASAGHLLAVQSLDTLTEKMTSEQIAEAQRLAREWKPRTGSQ